MKRQSKKLGSSNSARKSNAASNGNHVYSTEEAAAVISALEKAVACGADEMAQLMHALDFMLSLWDRRDQGQWTFEEIKRLEEIRSLLLSLDDSL